MIRRFFCRTVCAVSLLVLACDPASGPSPGGARAESEVASRPAPASSPDPPLAVTGVPADMRSCFYCHGPIVEAYLGHGMARSVGPVGTPPEGTVDNTAAGRNYEISVGEGGAWLEAIAADGGWRRQRLVGRIGAGIFDTSWVGMEVDALTGAETGRLFFAPVETITDHGLELSPFELDSPSAGLDLALGEECLTCHTTRKLTELPGAAAARGENLFPGNALGADAFEHLPPIGCEDCHGDAGRHVDQMPGGDLGLVRLGELPPGEQRDVCGRCHLQGDVRLDLAGGSPSRERPLAGQIPVLVASRPTDDFRFVSQLERLALSACFRASPEMTCTTCHDPHTSAVRQGTASFDAACLECHDCARGEEAGVPAVTGEPARTPDGCVDCHVRRSQPFDLPHVRSADHFIRRRIPPPQDDLPHRQFADPGGPLEIFDDGRLASALATDGGARWRSGVLAMGLMTLGRFEEAARRFASYPPPGTPEAVRATAPPVLVALEPRPSFHQMRAMAFMASGRTEEALAAFGDALKLDPVSPGALMSRARLRFAGGDVRGALEDTQVVIDNYPRAEHPWNLRAEMAERLNQPRLMTSALLASVEIWPSNAAAWYKLGRGLAEIDVGQSRSALERARTLSPGLFETR